MRATPRSATSDVTSRTIYKQQEAFNRKKKQQPGRRHQSVAMIVKSNSYCQYKKCPGLEIKKKPRRPYPTKYRCEECSIDKGSDDVWLCNTVKTIYGKQTKIECHMKYHSEKEFIVIAAAESSVVSDLTEE